MKHPTRTARASGGLRALAAAALDLTEARKAFREEMRRRAARALMGDMRIDDAEARTILPEAQRALRRLRGYVVALGGDPDADGAA